MTVWKKMWAVCRDGKVYVIHTTKRRAEHARSFHDMDGNSKHKWSVERVAVKSRVT